MKPLPVTMTLLLSAAAVACTAIGAQNEAAAPAFTSAGELVRPEGWREWVNIGTPLTPNALNGGEAPFPEFHSVYIDPASFKHWQETGEFREGTMIAKELASVIAEDAHEDGSTDQVSGRGYFMGELQGLEIALRDTTRFADEPGGWAYFSFGHQPEPYEPTAAALPTETCNACHAANADQDWVFTQFYPVLRATSP
ncbi:MAG: cytochrome P460 family protein [Geminicoccaceae bacterium]